MTAIKPMETPTVTKSPIMNLDAFLAILRSFHPPTQETTALAVEECVTRDGDFPINPYLASADSAAGRMTRRSLGGCAPNRFNAQWRSRVGLLGTTGLPVGLHYRNFVINPIPVPCP